MKVGGTVTTYAALLGAVNVGGRKVPMAQLRELLADMGYERVRTYLASGNAVFDAAADVSSDGRAAAGVDVSEGGSAAAASAVTAAAADETQTAIAAQISAALRDRFGFDVPCLVRTGSYLKSVVHACPFPADDLAGKHLHATFYSAPVAPDRYAEIDQPAFAPEAFRLGDRVLYLYAPDGVGRSPLAAALTKSARRRKDGAAGTSRNWNTVKALVEMTTAEPGAAAPSSPSPPAQG